MPVIFDVEHFCLLNLTFHTMLMDFRMRPVNHMQTYDGKIVSVTNLHDIFFPGQEYIKEE